MLEEFCLGIVIVVVGGAEKETVGILIENEVGTATLGTKSLKDVW